MAVARKVLFTASTYSHIVNFHLPYLRRFQEEGWKVYAACGGTAMPIPCADEVIHLPFEKSMWSPDNFKAASILRGKIRREGFDLVSTHTSLAAFFTRLALRGLGERPLVANMVHGYLFDGGTPRLKRAVLLEAERQAAPVTNLVLTMNSWDYETAKRYKLGREVVNIPGIGVDFSRLNRVLEEEARGGARKSLGIPEDAFVLLYAAEFSARKSQSVLIRAMERLPEGVVLVLAGDGTARAECEALSRQVGVADRVRFPGHVQDMGAFYAMADAAVSASRSEGLPFNVMEAMYAGLPVVASRVKGHTDLISDGVSGLLYPYGDGQALAERVLELLRSEDLRREMAARARENVEQYSLARVFPTVWGHYAALAGDLVLARK